MREIVLDTETTGMEPGEGHRLVEIGGLELHNHVPTGKTLHFYINPERPVPPEAVAVHGLNNEFLRDKPVFSEIYTDFLEFIGDSALVIHNAAFDMKFLNAELRSVGHGGLNHLKVTDTLDVARRKYPGSPASLDALCRRFNIDNSGRELHGALLDSQLLAEVYLELLGGRQHGLGLLAPSVAAAAQPVMGEDGPLVSLLAGKARQKRVARPHAALSAEEESAHKALLTELKEPLWAKS